MGKEQLKQLLIDAINESEYWKANGQREYEPGDIFVVSDEPDDDWHKPLEERKPFGGKNPFGDGPLLLQISEIRATEVDYERHSFSSIITIAIDDDHLTFRVKLYHTKNLHEYTFSKLPAGYRPNKSLTMSRLMWANSNLPPGFCIKDHRQEACLMYYVGNVPGVENCVEDILSKVYMQALQTWNEVAGHLYYTILGERKK